MKTIITAAVCVLFCGPLLSAAEHEIGPAADYQQLAEHLRQIIPFELEDKDVPAISIALVDGEEIVWAAGFGIAQQTDRRPADASTVYRVGSISKLLTDIAIMQRVEAGELNLDEPVQTYLPDFRPSNSFDVPITLRQLMSHRAGLVRESPIGNYFDASEPTLADTVASLNDTQLVYKPTTRTKYSNAGIALVGYVLEKTQGKPFPQLVREQVLLPMNMISASFEPLPEARDLMAEGWMWTYDGRQFVAPTFLLGTNAAGNLFGSVTDLGNMLIAMFRATDEDQSKPLRKATFEQMWTPQFVDEGEKSGFGLGFYVSQFEGKRRIGHGGAVYGHATRFVALPDEKLGVIVIANKDVANGLVDHIGDFALRAMLAIRAQQPLPTYQRTTRMPPERAQQLAGWYRSAKDPLDIVEVTAWNGQPRLRYADRRVDLRMVRDTIVADDLQGRGPELRLSGEQLMIGNNEYQRIDMARPKAAPEHWRGLLGEYGWDHNTLYILESHGRLYALIEWFFFYPLAEVDENTFRFPDDGGLYHGESLIFTRDENGRATKVVAASVEFPRRAGVADGETFRIQPVASVETLKQQALLADPPREGGDFRDADLVEIAKLDSTIHLDIRYAGENNFIGTPFYSQAKAFLQRPAAEALVRVHQKLNDFGYGLLVHDAYRPWYVTKMFFDATPPDLKIFVADPAKGSRHNRGSAVDLTLYDLESGEPVAMPSGYDEFSPRAFPEYPGGTSLERWQRDLLRRSMESEGFTVYEFEWWHFDYQDWQKYPILNLTFEQLSN